MLTNYWKTSKYENTMNKKTKINNNDIVDDFLKQKKRYNASLFEILLAIIKMRSRKAELNVIKSYVDENIGIEDFDTTSDCEIYRMIHELLKNA